MRVLLDNNVNRRFGRLLDNVEVVHVQNVGWEELVNGELIAAAENAGYDALITADKSMRHEQSLRGRKISVIVLASGRITLRHIAPLADQVNREDVPLVVETLAELRG